VGIAPLDVPGFVIAEMIAALIIVLFFCKTTK